MKKVLFLVLLIVMLLTSSVYATEEYSIIRSEPCGNPNFECPGIMLYQSSTFLNYQTVPFSPCTKIYGCEISYVYKIYKDTYRCNECGYASTKNRSEFYKIAHSVCPD